MRARLDPFPRTKWSDPLTYTDAQKRSDLMGTFAHDDIAAIESMLTLWRVMRSTWVADRRHKSRLSMKSGPAVMK